MSLTRTNRMLITAAAMVGVAAGAAGIAGAVTGGDTGQDPSATTTEQTETVDTDGGPEAEEGQESADEGQGGADEHEGDEEDEGPEPGDAALIEGAAVSQSEAEATARAEVPGTVARTEIEDEDGTVVWDVEIDAEDGSEQEVTVDATTGAVTKTEAGD